MGKATHNLVGNVVPHVRLPLRLPQALPPNHELQVHILLALVPRDPPILHLRKVALKEGNLVLLVRTRSILILPHHAKVVKHLALVNRRRRLRDQLRAPHGLPVPEGRVVERQPRTLLRDVVGRVLVVGGEVDVGGGGRGPVDVPLVGPDLVGPGPRVEVGGGGEVVEAAVPEDGSGGEGEERCEGGGELHGDGGCG